MRRLRAGLDLASATGAVVVGLNAAHTIDINGWRLTTAVIVIGAAAISRVGLEVVARNREERTVQFTKAVSEALRSALVQIVEQSDLEWTEVGLNAFLVRSPAVPWQESFLERVGRERIKSHPTPSSVHWTLGKGVIGQCWERGTDIGVDLTDAFAGLATSSQAEWSALTPEEAFGMTFADFTQTKEHGAVVATPILSTTGEVLGVVSVDGPEGSFDRLFGEATREAIGAAAITIRNLDEA
jgi:hypothetical protein